MRHRRPKHATRRLRGMQSTWVWIVFNLWICASATLENDITKAFIELTELGYEDTCHDTAAAEWTFINSPTYESLSTWEENVNAYVTFKKTQKDEVQNITKANLKDASLKYKYDVIEKPGDALLKNEDFETFVHLAGTIEVQRGLSGHSDGKKNYTRKDVNHILTHSNDIEEKRSAWATWHQTLTPLVQNFSDNVQLLQEAAKANDAGNVAEYWEILSGYPKSYDKIRNEWNRVIDLHRKVLNFGIAALSHNYGLVINETMPAYLLGSLDGYDWTSISIDLSPHPDVMYDIKKNLWKKRLIGRSLYTTASTMGSTVLNQVPQADFWDKSEFNQQCPPKLINFCREGIMRVSTCFEPTVTNFIFAHKNVGKILFNQMSVEATPILNTANRYSGLEEGVSELFGILSASPAWLNYTRLMDATTDNDQRLIVSLMITALNVLPRLAYYISADMWRLNAIEKQIKEPVELVSSWWTYRQEYEGIASNGTDVPTFLNDDHIVRNKPYLPKFLGTLIGFQLYESIMDSTEIRYDRLLGKQVNANFIKMIQHGAADGWLGVVDKYIELEEISADALVSFFSPLDEFLDEIDEDFEYKAPSGKPSELEEIERKIIQEINAPTTTSTTTTTTTTATPTTIVTKRRMTNTTTGTKQAEDKLEKDVLSVPGKNLESQSSIHIDEKKTPFETEVSTKVPSDKSLIDSTTDEQDNKPKINTSKAVWAVGAVLLATIVICIVAIFGRQRCRKTPKNRRYV